MKTYSFFTDKFIDLKLTKKDIVQRKNQQGGTLNYYNDPNFDLKYNKGFPEIDYYYEYKKLGGKKNRRKYFEILDIFLEETYPIFINGDPTKYNSRNESLDAVMEIANIDEDELDILFDSVDSVTSYT